MLDPALAPPSSTAARRSGPQPRPILVKGDLRRFPSPPGVDEGPLRIQARPLHPLHLNLGNNISDPCGSVTSLAH